MSLFNIGANMENEIENELRTLYSEKYYSTDSPYVFGAYVAAVKKRLKADLMIAVLYKIAQEEKIDLTYHTSLKLCKLFMSRGILGERLFLHFANVENNGDGLTKREVKRTAKDKISIDYICIKNKYQKDVESKLSRFDLLFDYHNKAIKKSYRK